MPELPGRVNLENKPFITWDPKEFCKKYDVGFMIPTLELDISYTNFPENIIYDPDLQESDDMFYRSICSDTTLSFYVEHAIAMLRSLISRAVHEKDKNWEYGPITVSYIEGKCRESWMSKTITAIALREIEGANVLVR